MRRVAVVVVVLLFALAGAIAAVAVADHRHKSARLDGADVAAWYCAHRGQRCAETKPEAIEGAWQQREVAYRIGFSALALGGVTVLVLSLGSRSRDRLQPRRLQARDATDGDPEPR